VSCEKKCGHTHSDCERKNGDFKKRVMPLQLEETRLLKNNREPKLSGQDKISFLLSLTKNQNIFSPSHIPT